MATPYELFPENVWLSIAPSPVITRSAPFIFLFSSVASIIISAPGLILAFKNATSPAPRPPAAPAPFILLMSLPMLLFTAREKFRRPSSRS